MAAANSEATKLGDEDFRRLGVRPWESRSAVIREAAARSTRVLFARYEQQAGGVVERELSLVVTSAYRLLDPRQRLDDGQRAHVGRILPLALAAAARPRKPKEPFGGPFKELRDRELGAADLPPAAEQLPAVEQLPAPTAVAVTEIGVQPPRVQVLVEEGDGRPLPPPAIGPDASRRRESFDAQELRPAPVGARFADWRRLARRPVTLFSLTVATLIAALWLAMWARSHRQAAPLAASTGAPQATEPRRAETASPRTGWSSVTGPDAAERDAGASRPRADRSAGDGKFDAASAGDDGSASPNRKDGSVQEQESEAGSAAQEEPAGQRTERDGEGRTGLEAKASRAAVADAVRSAADSLGSERSPAVEVAVRSNPFPRPSPSELEVDASPFRRPLPTPVELAAARDQLREAFPSGWEASRGVDSGALVAYFDRIAESASRRGGGEPDQQTRARAAAASILSAELAWAVEPFSRLTERANRFSRRYREQPERWLRATFAASVADPRLPGNRQRAIENGWRLAEWLLVREHAEECLEVLLSLEAALVSGDHESSDVLVREYRAAAVEVARLRSEVREAESLTLDWCPPEAAARVGRYRCLLLRQWESGLPWLSHSADPRLAALAEQELVVAAEATVADRVALAGRWLRVGSDVSGRTAGSIRLHAIDLLREALEDAAEIDRLEIEKRLRSVEADLNPVARFLLRPQPSLADGPTTRFSASGPF